MNARDRAAAAKARRADADDGELEELLGALEAVIAGRYCDALRALREKARWFDEVYDALEDAEDTLETMIEDRKARGR